VRFRKQRKGQQSSPIWLTIFSDMTTNLMMFFLMLFAMSRMPEMEKSLLIQSMKSHMEEPGGDSTEQAVANARARQARAVAELRNVLQARRMREFASLEEDANRLRITLTPSVFFETGSDVLSGEAAEKLRELARSLKRFRGDIIIEGHTDNVPVRGGRYASNWELSVGRAVRVIDLFIAEGIPPRQLVCGGYGEFHPAFPNDTPENRARNRRIEITVMKEVVDEP